MPTLLSHTRYILTAFRPLTISMGLSFVLPLRQVSTTATPKGEARCSRYLYRKPWEGARWESPYPVVFLRVKGLGLQEEGEWSDWSGMLAEKGYTSIEIDITSGLSSSSSSSSPSSEPQALEISSSSPSSPKSTFPDPDPQPDNPPSPFPSMVTALNSQIRLMAIPFPPIIVARGGSTLLAQAYVEDHPASGLVLLDPLPDRDPRDGSGFSVADRKKEEEEGSKCWKWPVFTYEPHFPLLVLSSQDKMIKASVDNRLIREFTGENPNKSGWTLGRRGRGKGVELAIVDEGDNGGLTDKGRIEVERWMDRCGF
ncbi:hypothetical protein IAR55_000616 [Kwoniella newhampshirensis]|uniref:AB hydrolase-1 domain-containing protein n=1 Tax=Kwoniella newhampshirensis TaxID=1651941 RepID=A0AAW0Z9J0_9TREE